MIKIDASKLTKAATRELTITLCAAVNSFFEDDKNRAAFDAWLAERKKGN